MKKLNYSFLAILIFCLSLYTSGQAQAPNNEEVIVLFSSVSTQEQLDEFIEETYSVGLQFIIHKLEWKNEDEIRSIRFEIKNLDNNTIFSPATFNYNGINNSEILIIKTNSEGFGAVLADVTFIQLDMWNTDGHQDGKVKVVSNFQSTSTFSSSALPTNFFNPIIYSLRDYLRIRSQIKADRDFSINTPHFHYYVNGKRLVDSFHLPVQDMSATVEFKNDHEDYPSIYFKSEVTIPSIAFR